MKKLNLFILLLTILIFTSCKQNHKDVVLNSAAISLPASHYYYYRFNTIEMIDWKSIEFIARSDSNDLNYYISVIPFSFFMGHEKEDYDSLVTADVINKYKIKESAVSKSTNYHFQYNRRKKDDLAALDMFVLYFEDTSLGILSASSSNVSFKIVLHK